MTHPGRETEKRNRNTLGNQGKIKTETERWKIFGNRKTKTKKKTKTDSKGRENPRDKGTDRTSETSK